MVSIWCQYGVNTGANLRCVPVALVGLLHCLVRKERVNNRATSALLAEEHMKSESLCGGNHMQPVCPFQVFNDNEIKRNTVFLRTCHGAHTADSQRVQRQYPDYLHLKLLRYFAV